MTEQPVVRQRDWSERELFAAGFQQYDRKKVLVMARELPVHEAPKKIETPWDSLTAEAGAMICYDPGETVRAELDDYHHWPSQRDLSDRQYAAWDEPEYVSSAPEAHLLQLGCKPYYKVNGVWARQLDAPTYVQSIESEEPALAPAGSWLCIGLDGEPWTQDDESFRARYKLESV